MRLLTSAILLFWAYTSTSTEFIVPKYFKEFTEYLNENFTKPSDDDMFGFGGLMRLTENMHTMYSPGGLYDKFQQALENPEPDPDEDPFIFNRTFEYNDVVKYIEKLNSFTEKEGILEKLEFFAKNIRKFLHLHYRFGSYMNSILKKTGNLSLDEEKATKMMREGILGKLEGLAKETKSGDDHRIRLSIYNEKIREPIENILKLIVKVVDSPPEKRESAVRELRYDCGSEYKQNVIKNFESLFRDACRIPWQWTTPGFSYDYRDKRSTRQFFGSSSRYQSERYECALSEIVKDVEDRMSLVNATLEELFIDLLRASFLAGSCESIVGHPPGFFDKKSGPLSNVTAHIVGWIRAYQKSTWPRLGEDYSKGNLWEAFAGKEKIDPIFYEMAAGIIVREFEDREVGDYQYQVVVTPSKWGGLGDMYASIRTHEKGYYHAIQDFKGIVAHIFKFKEDSALSRIHKASLWFEEMRHDLYHQIESNYLKSHTRDVVTMPPISYLLRIDGYHGMLLLRNKRFFAEDAYIPHSVSFKEINGTKTISELIFFKNPKIYDAVCWVLIMLL